MFSWLTKRFMRHLIPHEGNNHRPHALRRSSMRNIVTFILLVEIVAFILPALTHISYIDNMASVLPGVLANLTNQERESQRINILRVNPKLNKAAEMKAQDMASNGYFAHVSPDGKTPWYWLKQVGYKYQYAGENLAINFIDSQDVTEAWMNSPSHKSNIIKKNYTEIGTGVATGIYEGRETVFVAQVYANPFPVENKITTPKEVTPISIPPITEVAQNDSDATNILGAEVENINKNTLLQGIASPRNTVNLVLYFIFGFILLSLVLYVLLNRGNHHSDLITNGLMALVIVLAIFLANYYYSYKSMIVLDGVDYSN